MAKRNHDAEASMDNVSYRSCAAWRGQQKRRGRPLDFGGVVNAEAQEIVPSDEMYDALEESILALEQVKPCWTEIKLKQQFDTLYRSYATMNAVEPYAFESRAANKVASGRTSTVKIYGLMKRYLVAKQVASTVPV